MFSKLAILNYALAQGFAKFTFKDPNLNSHYRVRVRVILTALHKVILAFTVKVLHFMQHAKKAIFIYIFSVTETVLQCKLQSLAQIC